MRPFWTDLGLFAWMFGMGVAFGYGLYRTIHDKEVKPPDLGPEEQNALRSMAATIAERSGTSSDPKDFTVRFGNGAEVRLSDIVKP